MREFYIIYQRGDFTTPPLRGVEDTPEAVLEGFKAGWLAQYRELTGNEGEFTGTLYVFDSPLIVYNGAKSTDTAAACDTAAFLTKPKARHLRIVRDDENP